MENHSPCSFGDCQLDCDVHAHTSTTFMTCSIEHVQTCTCIHYILSTCSTMVQSSAAYSMCSCLTWTQSWDHGSIGHHIQTMVCVSPECAPTVVLHMCVFFFVSCRILLIFIVAAGTQSILLETDRLKAYVLWTD